MVNKGFHLVTYWRCRIPQAQSYACEALSAVTYAVYRLDDFVLETILTSDIAGHPYSLWSVSMECRVWIAMKRMIFLRHWRIRVKLIHLRKTSVWWTVSLNELGLPHFDFTGIDIFFALNYTIL